MNTTARELTQDETRMMRRKHFVVIPVILVVSLILFAVITFDKLPEPARWAGGGIASLAAIIFVFKHIKMERDLRNGVVHIISGKITEKRKMGGNFKTVSSGTGVGRGSKTRPSSTTYFIFIDQQKFNVPVSIYSSVQEGDRVEMDYFPKSKFYLGIRVIDELK